jgi:hypothetical protein
MIKKSEEHGMNLINRQVQHKEFGNGKIIEHTASCVNILFSIGVKKFLFPEAFGAYLELTDKTTAEAVEQYSLSKQLETEASRQAQMPEQQPLAKPRRRTAKRKELFKKVTPDSNVAYRFNSSQAEEILTQWTIPSNSDKKTANRGCPARMHRYSVCLITALDEGETERQRKIVGAFMPKEDPGRTSLDDRPISAHPKYRVCFLGKEADSLSFWDFFTSEKSPDQMTWTSGKQRYVDNLRIAQILKKAAAVKEDSMDKELAEQFFLHFCKTNRVDAKRVPPPSGVLTLSN